MSRGRPTSTVVSRPAPVGGWNTRDSVDQMDPKDAVILTNWFPDVGKVKLRLGHSSYATGLGGNVDTLAEYHAGATRKFLAAANGNIWDVSTSTPSSLGAGFTNNRWQWINFNANMLLMNGADTPQVFNGSAIANTTISGPTVTSIIGANVFKSRLYVWESSSQNFWYGAVNAIGGAFTQFPLSRVSNLGGNLVGMGTWTIDGGSGVDDFAVFIMSSGDVIVYQGSDPGSATDWSLVGIYRIAAPIAIRGIAKYAGDLVVITDIDYVGLSEVLRSGRTEVKRSKASGALQSALNSYRSNYGWQAILYPRGRMLIFNVPINASFSEQHVKNIVTGSWCKFSGWNTRCFGLYNDRLYFGGNGVIYLADDGYDDNSAAVNADAQTAWDYMGSRGRIKRFTGIRPNMETQGNSLSISVAVGTDYKEQNVSSTQTVASVTDTAWDTATWDVDPWASEFAVLRDWQSVLNLGYNASARVKISTGSQSVNWNSTDYLFEPGGLI